MPRRPEDNQRIKDERRDAILRAARDVFARKGLGATKMTDISANAEFSYGLVYHYFRSKEAVYCALVEDAVQQGLAMVEEAVSLRGSARERLCWLFDHLLGILGEEPTYLLVAIQAFTSEAIPDEARAQVQRLAEDLVKVVRDLVVQGQAQGDLRGGDPTELAMLYFAMVQGLTLNRYAGRERYGKTPSAALVIDLFAAPPAPRPKRGRRG